MSPADSHALQAAVSAFVRGFGLLNRERTPCGLDLHVSDAHLIGDLSSEGPLGQKQIAERLHLSKSTVSRMVSQLIDRGWVRREPDVADGRAVVVSLTDAGCDVADRLRRSRAHRFDDLLRAVPDDRRAVVIEGVRHLADAACSATRGVAS